MVIESFDKKKMGICIDLEIELADDCRKKT